MYPTEILKNEHRVIEQVLDCLEIMAAEATNSGHLDSDGARQALDFLRVFADQCHHHKEEEHLFTLLEHKGFPRQGGPTGVMMSEHEQGRAHIRAMSEAIDAGEIARFAQHAREYVELLRQHIFKEDNVLFRMADAALTPDEQITLMAAFDNVEHHDMHEGTHEKYLHIADELAERFGVVKGHTVSAGEGCLSCGCHAGVH